MQQQKTFGQPMFSAQQTPFSNPWGGPQPQQMPAGYTPNPSYVPPNDPYQRTATGAPRPLATPAYQAGVAAQSGKDQAAFNAAGNLGVAGQNAMGQYGMSKDQALVNSQIAQANAMGQMANAYYNTMGQGMQYSAALGAAGAAAGAQSNAAGALGGLFGGGGGFQFSGPGGFGGSGSWGAGKQGGGQGGGGGGQYNPYTPIGAGFASLNNFRQDLGRQGSQANLLRQDVNSGFGQTQKNLMDPSIRNAMMEQMRMGYGALDGLYDKSDYGFNTGAAGVSQDRNQFGTTRRFGF